MVSKMMETEEGDEKKSKTPPTKKKSVLERLEPTKTKHSSVRKGNQQNRHSSPTTFYNNNSNNRGVRGRGRGRMSGFFNRGFGRGGGRIGFRNNSNRLAASLSNQFPAKKESETGDVVVQAYGAVIIRISTTGETRIYREGIEAKNYAKALKVMNEHLKKIGFSITPSNEDGTTTGAGAGDSCMVDQEGGGGGGGTPSPRWGVSGMKKFMLFVEGMILPPPPSPGPGRGLALLLPTKV